MRPFRTVISLMIVTLSGSAFGGTCPDISGNFVYFKGSSWEYEQVVKQVGCNSVNAGEPFMGFAGQLVPLNGQTTDAFFLDSYRAYIKGGEIVQESVSYHNDGPREAHKWTCMYSLDSEKNLSRHCRVESTDQKVIWDITDIGIRK